MKTDPMALVRAMGLCSDLVHKLVKSEPSLEVSDLMAVLVMTAADLAIQNTNSGRRNFMLAAGEAFDGMVKAKSVVDDCDHQLPLFRVVPSA